MYFVNRSEIEQMLILMDTLLEEVKVAKSFSTNMEKLALERIIHIVIELIMDVGNKMIDGFIMRDPGSYHDIIDILIDELVIPENEEKAYKAIIDLRQSIVQNYLEIDHTNLAAVLAENVTILTQFSHHIITYLDNELGVANAFAKE